MKDADLESLCRNDEIRVRRELVFSQDQLTINFALFARFQIDRQALKTYFRSCQSFFILYREEESSFCNAKPTGFNFCECFGRHGIRQLSEGIRRVQTKSEDTDPTVYCIRRQSLRTSSIDTSSFAVESRCYEFRSSV